MIIKTEDFELETLAMHTGIHRSQFNEHSEALYLTSSFVFDNAAQAAARFSGAAAILPQPDFFIPIIGQNAIITGLGLALLGLSGRLLRILIGIAALRAETKQPDAVKVDHHGRSPAQSAPRRGIWETSHAAADPARDIITRGALNGRGYVLFRDGTVVVETLLGPKRFGSMTDAQNFIIAN